MVPGGVCGGERWQEGARGWVGGGGGRHGEGWVEGRVGIGGGGGRVGGRWVWVCGGKAAVYAPQDGGGR